MKNSIGVLCLRFALAFILAVTGIWGITGGATIFNGIMGMFSGNIATIVRMCISVASILVGVLLLIEMFSADIHIVNVILLIFTILWLIQMVLSIIGALSSAFVNTNTALIFFYNIAQNLLILAALLASQNRFI